MLLENIYSYVFLSLEELGFFEHFYKNFNPRKLKNSAQQKIYDYNSSYQINVYAPKRHFFYLKHQKEYFVQGRQKDVAKPTLP